MAGPEAQAWQPEAGRRDWQTGRQLPYPLWRLRPVRPIPMPAAPQWLLGARDTTARRRSWQGEESFSVATAVQRCSSRTEEKQPLTSRSDPVGFQSTSVSITGSSGNGVGNWIICHCGISIVGALLAAPFSGSEAWLGRASPSADSG